MRYELDWETKGGRATRYTRRQIVLWRANRQLGLVGISTNRFWHDESKQVG